MRPLCGCMHTQDCIKSTDNYNNSETMHVPLISKGVVVFNCVIIA